MQQVIVFIHVIVSLLLIGLVLIQHGKGADIGASFGSGAANTIFGSQGSSSFLTRFTAVLATIFFITSLTLGALAVDQVSNRESIFELPIDQQPVIESEDAAAKAVIGDAPSFPAETEQRNERAKGASDAPQLLPEQKQQSIDETPPPAPPNN